MGFNNIEKRNIWYSLTKVLFVDPWHNLIFYRKITVNNASRVPKDGPLIFTPNHQNALLDALALLCTVPRPLVFLARSDIFKKKKIARILYFLKILPVFRIRDGYSSLKNNSDTFQKTIDVITGGNGLVILPEGDYVRKYQLRPLKKGFARIAFQTEEARDFKLNLKIIPVGLHYSDYDERRSELIINYGEPIIVSDYYNLYKANPAIALNQISAELTKRLKLLMVDLPVEDYSLFAELLKMKVLDLKAQNAYHKTDLVAENQFVDKLTTIKDTEPEKFENIKETYLSYSSKLRDAAINKDILFSKILKPFPFIIKQLQLLLGLPLFLYGAVNNLLPYLLTEFFVQKVKDADFRNSFRFVISLLVFLISYILQTILIIIFMKIWWVGIIYFFSLPISFNLSICYVKGFRKIVDGWRILLFKIKKPKKSAEMLKVKGKLLRLIRDI